MKIILPVTSALALSAGLLLSAPASAVVLTYDDIGVADSVYPGDESGFVEMGYHFSYNMDVVDVSSGSTYAAYGPAYSGNYAALNDNGGNAFITQTDGGTFSFDSTYIKEIGGSSEGTITGFLDGNQVDSVDFTADPNWSDVIANFADVDAVIISAGPTFLLDNTVIDAPEPASIALLGMGLLGLNLMIRRKRA